MFCMVTPIVSSKNRHLYQFCYVKIFSTNQNRNLLMLDDPGRVRSQIISVVCQIQRFDVDCNMVVTRKVIPVGTGTHPPMEDNKFIPVIGYYRGFERKGARVRIIRYYFSRHYQTDCSQNQTAVSYTLRLLSDF
jgi:hypothetical protein